MFKVVLFLAIIIIALPAEAQNQTRKPTVKDFPGSEKSSVKHQITLYNPLVFPGVGSQKDWREANQLVSQAGKLHNEGKFEKSLILFDKAIKLYPHDPRYYNSKAFVYFARQKKGDLESAIQLLRKAIEIKPNSCMYWDNLAKGLCEQGKYKESREALRTALRFSPSGEKSKEIEGNIQRLNKSLGDVPSTKNQ